MAVRYGRYEVLYKLGQGAMAQVFLAKDPVLSRFVAVKVLHAGLATRKDVLQRFFIEARTVAALRSPHVVEVFDFGQADRDLYLVMEFVDGMSLHALLRHAGPGGRGAPAPVGTKPEPSRFLPSGPGVPGYEPLPPDVAAALICQAADGLTVAAAQGVVHRDLKPENLMINTRGYLKLSDFGIAHVQDESLTRTGAVLGSPLYMSPEQAQGLKPITAQSDLFSLGSVLYACLAGHPPFRGRTVTDLFRRIAAEPHTPLARLRADLDPGLGELADTLLRKRPAERGGGPRWLHQNLKAYLMARGIMDPAELTAGYLRVLSDRGLQTTWELDGRNATLPLTLAATLAGGNGTRPADTLGGLAGAEPEYSAASQAASMPARSPLGPSGRQAREPVHRARAGVPATLWIPAMAILAIFVVGGAGLGAWGWHRVRDSLGESYRRGTDADPSPRRGPDGAAFPAEERFAPERDPVPDRVSGGAAQDPFPETDPGDGGAMEKGVPGADAGLAGDSSRSGLHASAAGSGNDGDRPESKVRESILILKSSPPFSDAYLDGQFIGTTPVRIAPLAAGRHRLAMKSGRLPGLDTTIWVEPGVHALKVHLEGGPGMRVAATSVDGD